MKGLIKFISCGSVDDGKSTLIGHMLYDAKLLFADQEKALVLDSKVGSRGGKVDYSLLLDGLMAEREQGITIDVAYRYFSTERRSFIVADTPGHEEYTRNMAVGASFADLAVILVDASKGVLVQTKRHTRICALMGIRHFVFAVNKMDLVDYSQRDFERIQKEIRILMAEFSYESVQIIPVSATEGDHITHPSEHMGWYKGVPLLTYLEEVDVSRKEGEQGFTLPIQLVCRPDRSVRGFQGQVETGRARTGDTLTVLPSGEQARISRLYVGQDEKDEVFAGQPVTLSLDREIDVSRGCVLVKDANPSVAHMFTAQILWMDDGRLVAGKNYLLRVGTKKAIATCMRIKYKIDVNSGDQVPADSIRKNELAVCDFSVSEKIVFDAFSHNSALGSLILIDRVTHMTSACGTIHHALRRSENIFPYEMTITREMRENQKGQKAKTIWLTGLSGSGKSTLANELEKRLFAAGRHVMTLDGDNVRQGLNQNLGFKEADRIENIRRVAEAARLMNDAGLIVIASFVSPYERDRVRAREIIGDENFIEIYVSTSLEVCEERDVKGLYAKAREGKIPNFTGISSVYEIPSSPELTVDTAGKSIEESADALYEQLRTMLS